ncbi:hypothetical protein BDP27DRAFT_1337037 [Rhodocollybia butyracea]|uniref:Hemerythrin-like domain-containing protein n=1 Tax=Rhodocollybia butyracea TaxID=206335 RepID=A0A9P5PG78_9AGAR|nr:hypothetical protein BDP27DRAFT_1337037 [Rhodocollybia butyracea]
MNPLRLILTFHPHLHHRCRAMSSNPFSKVQDEAASRDERKWNKLSRMMSSFHEGFKEQFNTLYELSDGSFNKRGWSLGLYLESAKRFNDHLTMHHTIEEAYIFPILGRRMKQFSTESDGEHLASHKGIHDGLQSLKSLIHKCKADPTSYSPTEMRACLDNFREVLFSHLDQEVQDLQGENLKKYFTLKEVEEIPV